MPRFRMIVLPVWLLLSFFYLSLNNQPVYGQVNDPGTPDTLRVGSVTGVIGGDKFAVPLHMYNDEFIAAVQIPLIFSSSAIACDSVSFVGSKLAHINIKPVNINNVERKIILGAIVIAEALIDTGTALAATLYFTAVDTTPQLITVDTFSTQLPSRFLNFVPRDTPVAIIPVFIPGQVEIVPPPPPPPPTNIPGDLNADGIVNVLDLLILINYHFGQGPAPYPPGIADINGDCMLNAADIVYLIQALFFTGPAPQKPCFPGDVNGDGLVTVLDIIYLINYLFTAGPAPLFMNWADVNADCVVDVLDVIHLINFQFLGGAPLLPGCDP